MAAVDVTGRVLRVVVVLRFVVLVVVFLAVVVAGIIVARGAIEGLAVPRVVDGRRGTVAGETDQNARRY